MLDLSNRHVVMFDFDGTVANTKASIVSTATRALTEFGLGEDELGDVSRLIGPPFPEAYQQVYGLSAADAQLVTNRYREIYATLGPKAWPLFEGMRELVRALHAARKKVCVATSKRQHVLEKALTDEGMYDEFDLKVGKPSDEPFSKAQTIALVLELAGTTANEAVMVGDRRHDVDGATACGVPCVGVTYGGTGDYAELAEAGACRVVDTVAQLAEVLLGPTHETTPVGVKQ